MKAKLPKGTLEKLWSDPVNWHGPFYHCERDPRNIVPKRIKTTGWTINFAHPSAWIGILIRMAVLASVLAYLKTSGYLDPMYAVLVMAVVYSIWDGRRASSPRLYEEE